MIKTSLTVKIVAVVLGFSTLILTAILANNYFFSRNLIIQQAEGQSRASGREVALQLAALIKPVEQAAHNIALALEDASLTQGEISSLSHRVVANNIDIFAMSIAFEPYQFSLSQHYFAPYSYRVSDGSGTDGIKTTQSGNSDYHYFSMDWYQLPKELGQPVWTEPYFDRGGSGKLMTTYAVPFYRLEKGQKCFSGVVTANITLDWLQEIISSIQLYDTGYAAILSRHGTYIYHPIERLMVNETVFSLAEELGDQQLWEIGRSMIEGKTGFFERFSIRGHKRSFLFYMPLPIDGWSLAILIPTNEALKGVNALMRNTLLIGLCGFVFLSVGTIFVVRRLTQPVRDLSVATLEIAKGNFNAPLPQTKSSDEVGQLSDSFGFMQTSLREYIVDLKETTTQKERIEAELRIARDIQMGILPKLFPAFPDHDEFDIYASLESAKEVGGDLYDFFFIDDHHFCFLVGDVSGKGVPAAFFMAVTKTLIKVIAERELQPDVILAKVNNDLAEDNESCMFVTLFLAVIDIRIGEVIYSSAGHNPPLLLTANEVAFMVPGNEPVAGAMPGVKYTSGKLTLASGDTMFLYTDGVTEAMNHEQKLYSEQRLLNLLTATTQRAATDIIHQVNRSIIEFASGAEQSDDITMLALTYTGGNNPPPRSDNDAI